MQDKSLNMALISVPLELLEEIDLCPMDVIQMSVSDGRLIVEKATDTDFECDGDCENCPFIADDCVGVCELCPCGGNCLESEAF